MLTLHGAEEQRQRAGAQQQLEAQRQAQARQQSDQRRQTLERAATHSIVWAAIGTITFCVPIFSVVGIVLSLRAWRLAKAEGLAKPASATIGLALGVGSLALAVACWGALFIIGAREAAEKQQLAREIGQGPFSLTLDPSIACKMAHLEVANTDYADYSEINDEFICSGDLVTNGQRAVLHRSKVGKHKDNVSVFACFKRGADRWYITELRSDALCAD